LSDLGVPRGNGRGSVAGFRPGPVPAGSGGFWPASRVPESVRRIVNSVLLTVRIGSARAAKQATDEDFGRVHQECTSKGTYTLEDRLLVPPKMWISGQVVDNWRPKSRRGCA
jgi:hypothetical protein